MFWREYIIAGTEPQGNKPVHKSGPLQLWICLKCQEAISLQENSRATLIQVHFSRILPVSKKSTAIYKSNVVGYSRWFKNPVTESKKNGPATVAMEHLAPNSLW